MLPLCAQPVLSRQHYRAVLIIAHSQCMDAAFALLDIWMNFMHSKGHMPYAPDFFFVGTGFAAAFLLGVRLLSLPLSVIFSQALT
jgi:hypothetical protein